MRVLILGGTGAIGGHLVSLVAKYAERVVVTSRRYSGIVGNIEYVTGNARKYAFLDELLSQRWDVIVDFMLYSTRDFTERRALLLNATAHYIYLSSARVYAESEKALTEDSPRLLDSSHDKTYLATDEYALSKARQENLLFDSKQKNWSIIRPYITYGNDRLQLGVLEKEEWLYRALKKRTIIASSDINTRRTTLTHGHDVASGIGALLGLPQALGEVFHITTNTTIAWSKVLDTYVDVLYSHIGEKPRVVLQDLEGFLRLRRGRHQIIYDRLYHRQFDSSKISRYVDTSKFLAPEEGIAQCLDAFLKRPFQPFGSISWRSEALKARLLKENVPLAEISGVKNKFEYLLFRHLRLVQG